MASDYETHSGYTILDEAVQVTKRQGLERGLWSADGTVADWLAGDVVVVLDEREGGPAGETN
jgi:hypothetical protein